MPIALTYNQLQRQADEEKARRPKFIGPRPEMQNENEDVAKYGSIDEARTGGDSSVMQYLRSLGSELPAAFGFGDRTVTGLEGGANGPQEAARKTAQIAVPVSALASGPVNAIRGTPLAGLALNALRGTDTMRRVAGAAGGLGAAAAGAYAADGGMPESNHGDLANQPAQDMLPRKQKPSSSAQQSAEMAGIPADSVDYPAAPAESRPFTPVETDFSGMVPRAPTDYTDEADYAQPSMRMGDESNHPGAQEANSVMQQIMQTMEPQAPQEKFDKESVAAYGDLTKNRDTATKEPTSTLGKIGRGISKFVTNMSAPGGSYDPTRYDTLQQDLRQKKSQFTPQEALRGEVAVSDIAGTRDFNRKAQLKQQDTGGLTDKSKLASTMEMQRTEHAAGRESQKQLKDLDLRNRMAELGMGAGLAKLTPEMQRAQTQHDVLKTAGYMLSPEEFTNLTGMDVSQEGLDAWKMAAQNGNPMAIVAADILRNRMEKQQAPAGKGAKPAPNLTTKALGAK